MNRTIVFDVNETLLDLGVLEPPFQMLFGDATTRRDWFAQLIQLSMVVTATDTYRDFKTLAGEALELVAARQGLVLDDEGRASILGMIAQLPPHPEAAEALDRLGSAGFRLVALTNSPPATAAAQLTYAELIDRFDRVMSVDSTRRFKPHPAPYMMAADELGVGPTRLWMVAAHDWDVVGAMNVGFRGAFVDRPGQGYSSGYKQPDLIGADLLEVADGLIARSAAE
ncbi:MAG: haloacid dehalogenase type II [Acidimicrobiia bacterium]|nr:haloacid dehalogenase type II [Acidimicrobiia bacterium]